MNDKLLRAFITVSGYEIEEVDVNPRKNDRYPSEPIINYKLTKRDEIHPLDDLATVMEKHKITLSYSNDDCGVCISINNKDALCEFLHDSDAPSLIRKYII